MPAEWVISPLGTIFPQFDNEVLASCFMGGGIFVMGPLHREVAITYMLAHDVTFEASTVLVSWYENNAHLEIHVCRFHDMDHFMRTEVETDLEFADRVKSPDELRTLLSPKLIFGTA